MFCAPLVEVFWQKVLEWQREAYVAKNRALRVRKTPLVAENWQREESDGKNWALRVHGAPSTIEK